ncbi:MAG: fibrobacter succinogenes major paralogous domain-containing protein [Prevotellaceae bacterium]|jgi:uncharacterized protein (TIGR02145 family)|nr:fibrobacter succinogenes major paralogous domain-containing protein [Prevotellaceae bacterium]
MKTNLFLFAAFVAAFLSVSSFSAAQVTIGGGDQPAAGAVLDLNSTTKGGLLLSNVELTALDEIPATFPNAGAIDKQQLAGMVVYNTFDYLEPNGDGLYVWDGSKWNYIGGSDGMLAHTTIPAPNCSPAVPAVSFLAYNLGANAAELNRLYPGLSPAKQQMAYLANHDFNELDACVLGGMFQWGRKDHVHAVKIPEYLRYDGADNAITGQTSDAIPSNGKFYYGNYHNWYTGSDPDALWGNGVSIGTAIAGGIYSSNTNYYQKPVKTQYDPCPDGWRVPTQDEWERLTHYGCGTPQSAGGDFSTTVSGHGTINSGFTWIPVVCSSGTGQCIPSNSWTDDVTSSGYAVYKDSVWTAAKTTGVYAGLTDLNVSTTFTAKSLHDVNAPEPLLFLPSAGERNAGTNGNVHAVGTYGLYRSSTIGTGTYNYAIECIFSGVYTTYDNIYRAHGISVRCVKE